MRFKRNSSKIDFNKINEYKIKIKKAAREVT